MAEEKSRRIFSLHKEQRIRFHLQELKKVFQTLASHLKRFFISCHLLLLPMNIPVRTRQNKG